MEFKIWNHKLWIFNPTYPNGAKYYFILLTILLILSITIIFGFRYPVYQTFYGIIMENGKKLVRITVPIHELENFEEAIQKENIELKSIDYELQLGTSENIIYAYAIVSVSKKLLVKNNIIPIRLKVRNESIWDELSKKWKKGMKL